MLKQTLTVILAICLGLSASPATANVDDAGTRGAAEADQSGVREWRFRVLLNEREIGYHTFRVSEDGNRSRVEIDAEFNVRILFFNAYRYTHRNEELWQDGCLNRLDSVTDDNGEMLSVDGVSDRGNFIINTESASRATGLSCIRSFAYWNPAFLDSNRLLNAQTGQIVDVLISRRADEVIDISGNAVAALRYTLEMEDGTLSLWYSRDSHQWLALEAPAPGGRVLRYEPVELPFELPAGDRLAQG
ncbi:MAG: hypothetical protein HKN57_09320 [Xanthomonadales bacterium]|nr:hypothetical protein [Gammaproteobacteria bacterium]MBT8053412.1 hypothetical protein [Gammaproteobacteria bacterium]NND57441.1 hypothetical protein [Xanthomonadales bacterium]